MEPKFFLAFQFRLLISICNYGIYSAMRISKLVTTHCALAVMKVVDGHKVKLANPSEILS